MSDTKAFALTPTQAAIATPGDQPSVCVLGFGQASNISGIPALLALREAIDAALQTDTGADQ